MAITGIVLLSLVPIGCGLFLMGLSASASTAMTFLYKGGGVMLVVGGPLLSFARRVERGGTSGMLTALLIAVLSPLMGFVLAMMDFFGIVGNGWRG